MLLPQPLLPWKTSLEHYYLGLYHTKEWGKSLNFTALNLHSGKRQLKPTLGRWSVTLQTHKSPWDTTQALRLCLSEGTGSRVRAAVLLWAVTPDRLPRSSAETAAGSGIISSSLIMAIRLKTPGWEAAGERRKTQKEGKKLHGDYH